MTQNPTSVAEITATSVDDCLPIGCIVNSNSHMDYTVEIFKEHDRERPPRSEECGFGQPVFIRKTIDGTEFVIMAVIYDTRLVDPDQGRSGPRLAQTDQHQFTPGYVEEKTTLAGVALLGTAEVTSDGSIANPDHTMPEWTLEVDDQVLHCPPEMTAAFHTVSEDNLQLAYIDRLLNVAGPLGAEVTLGLVDRLRVAIQGDGVNHRVLDVIERNVKWQARTDRGVVR